MAKKKQNTNAPLTPIEIVLPIRGLWGHPTRSKQPPDTSLGMVNVVPLDRIGVLRISKRPGIVEIFANPFASSSGGSSSSSGPPPVDTFIYLGTLALDVDAAYNTGFVPTPGMSGTGTSVNIGGGLFPAGAAIELTGCTVASNSSFDTSSFKWTSGTLGAELHVIAGTFAGDTDGAGTLVKDGTGTLLLNSPATANTWLGTVVDGGTILCGGDGVIVTTALSINNSGTFDLSGTEQTIESITLDDGGLLTGSVGGVITVGPGLRSVSGSCFITVESMILSSSFSILVSADTLQIDSAISGAFNLFKRDNVLGNSGTLILTNTGNSWTGALGVGAGILKLGAVGAVPTNILVTMGTPSAGSHGTFDLNGFDQTVAYVTLDTLAPLGTNIITNSGAVASLSLNPPFDFAGADINFTGALGIVKIGVNAYAMPGGIRGTYTEPTSIVAGTLQMLLSNTLCDTQFNVAGGTFDFNNTSDDGTVTSDLSGGVLILNGGQSMSRGLRVGSATGGIKITGAGTATLSLGVNPTVDMSTNWGADIDAGSLLYVPAPGTVKLNGHSIVFSGGGTMTATLV